ncbi:hypothetical protein D3C85_943370 [compost metagenome]
MGRLHRIDGHHIGARRQGQKLQKRQLGRDHLLARLKHRHLLIGDARLRLDDVGLGHASGLDQGAVGFQQGTRSLQGLFSQAHLLLGQDQAAVGGDDGADSPGDRRLQLQPIDLFLQAGDADRGHVDGQAGATQQGLVQADARGFRLGAPALQRIGSGPDKADRAAQWRAPGR